MKNRDILNASGHLEIYKIYEDGTEEKVFDDPNTITSGMGVGLGLLYAGSGASNSNGTYNGSSITDFQIRYFQLGTQGDTRIDNYNVSTTMLASALGQINSPNDGRTDYRGLDYETTSKSTLAVDKHQLMDWDGGPADDSEGETNDWVYVLISDNSIKRVDLNSVTYILYIDRYSCNEVAPASLNEIGLFMKNPLGKENLSSGRTRSPLVAYRPFLDILKTDEFALVFKWTLNF